MSHQLFDSTTIPLLQEVASFTEARHNVLAGNIANVDTPGYRVRDLSVENFQQHMREAIEFRHTERREVASMGNRQSDQPNNDRHHVRDSLKSITFLDGSDVGIEQQVTEVAKNQYLHNLSVSIMNSQFRLLQAAISERV